MTAAVASCYASAPAWALNEADFKAVVGNFTASQTGNVKDLTLTTQTDRTLAEIQKRLFIPEGEILRIQQPTASSLFLLRTVPDGSGAIEKSIVNGSVWSNGQFWHQHAGLIIGKGAVIDTASFLATNMAVRIEDFDAARLISLQGLGAGDITVEKGAHIKAASGGSVYLIAANVKNEGIIETPGGETILAAGQTVNLIDTGTPGVKVEITGAEGDVTNLGTIVATAGRIGMAGVIVRNSGTLNASSVVSEGGRVFLKASKDAYVDGAGRIVVNGTQGGKVEVLGERVAVMDQAQIDASGTNGGGTVLVGGDYQGKNPDVQNATITYFGAEASVKADATDDGDGGKVIVWADDTTRAYGTISARGGASGGNGGFVETSGKQHLSFAANVDTRAPFGEAGTLLLDPADVTISNAATASGSFTGGIFSSSNSPSTVSWSDIITQLGSGNVVITTTYGGAGTGDITISASPSGGSNISITHTDSWGSWTNTYYGAAYSSSNSLSLLANRAVNVNAWFGNAGSGEIKILAGWDPASGTSSPALYGGFTAGQSININSGGGIATNGALTLKAVDSINIAGGASSAGIDANTALVSLLANKIALTGGGAGNYANAFIRSNGSQSFTVGALDSSGGLSLQGGSGAYYGGEAEIALYGTSGSQSFTIQNGAKVELKGGSATGLSTSYTGECSVAPGCTNARAQIRTNASGGQSFTFSNGGTLNVYGGSGGNGNDGSINNNGTGAQTITASAGSLNISLYGGTSGGDTAVYGGKTVEFDNSASIESKGSQTVSAATLYMEGGSASYGGAFLTAPTQNITLSGALTMVGGSLGGHGSAPAANDVYGDAIWYNPVVIGNDSANTVNLTVGSLSMTGGVSSNYGGSMALIGGYRVSTSVTIDSTGNIALNGANAGDDRIGSFGGYGGSVTLTSTGGGISLGKGYVVTGSSGTTTLRAYGGDITQNAIGVVETNSLNATTTQAVSDILLIGASNKVGYFSATAPDLVSFTNVTSTHVSSISAGGAITVVADDAPGTASIGLGTLTSTAGNISVTADGQIYDDNGFGTANVTGKNSITLSSLYGGSTSSSIAVSADVSVQSGGTPTISASVLGMATYGGISIRNVGGIEANSVSLNDNSLTNGYGDVSYKTVNSINMTTNTYNLNSQRGGVLMSSDGSVTLSSLATLLPGQANAGDRFVKIFGATGVSTSATTALANSPDLMIGSGGAMNISHNISGVSDLGLGSSGLMTISGATLSATRNLGLWSSGGLVLSNSSATASTGNVYLGSASATQVFDAEGGESNSGYSNITLTNSSITSTAGDVWAYTGNNMRLNNGSSITAGYGVHLGFGGADSTLYLNDTSSYANDSTIQAGAGSMIKLAFTSRSSGGVVIDGAGTTTSSVGGSGFFVGNLSTPAARGSTLDIFYNFGDINPCVINPDACGPPPGPDLSPTPADLPPPPLPPPPPGSGGMLLPLGGQTVGGGVGEFGDLNVPPPAPGPGFGPPPPGPGSPDGAPDGGPGFRGPGPGPENGPGPGAGVPSDQPREGGPGRENGAREDAPPRDAGRAAAKDAKEDRNEDRKEDKKEEKKEDKKAAKEGEKKDDKAKQKPVGKCSA